MVKTKSDMRNQAKPMTTPCKFKPGATRSRSTKRVPATTGATSHPRTKTSRKFNTSMLSSTVFQPPLQTPKPLTGILVSKTTTKNPRIKIKKKKKRAVITWYINSLGHKVRHKTPQCSRRYKVGLGI
jgi:hypothetical protein